MQFTEPKVKYRKKEENKGKNKEQNVNINKLWMIKKVNSTHLNLWIKQNVKKTS